METVPRNDKVGLPTAVKFTRGKNNIPHGLRFNAEDSGAGQDVPPTHSNPPSHEGSEPGEDPDLDDPNEEEKPIEPDRTPRRRSEPIPSNSSSSSSSSSPSEDNFSDNEGWRHRRRRRSRSQRRRHNKMKESKAEREERRAMERQKATPPSVYDGKADLLVFNKWTHKVNNWIRQSKYRDVTALRSLVSYVSGEAGQFFMDYIAGNEESWTIKTMYEAMFDYCFPMDFRDRLRTRLMQSTQGKRRIRDFVRNIEKLAARFPDVNERTVIQTFWSGMRQELHICLIEWGISPEHTPLEAIVNKAIDIENSKEAYRRELRNEK